MTNRITVFTKPWRDISLEQLADRIAGFGADGVELTVRDGYQVTPAIVAERLPRAVRTLAERDLVVSSVAAPLTEGVVRAMGECGIPLLRVCVGIDMRRGYNASVEAFRGEIKTLAPALRAGGVRVGVQNHNGHLVASALGIMHLLDGIDADLAAAVLDFAHCALDGEPVDMAVDIVKERLALVNFKNACRVRVNGPDEREARWQVLWTTARHGGYSWREAVWALEAAGYEGDLCLPGEYNRLVCAGVGTEEQLMGDEVDERVAGDLSYLRSLLGGGQAGPSGST